MFWPSIYWNFLEPNGTGVWTVFNAVPQRNWSVCNDFVPNDSARHFFIHDHSLLRWLSRLIINIACSSSFFSLGQLSPTVIMRSSFLIPSWTMDLSG